MAWRQGREERASKDNDGKGKDGDRTGQERRREGESRIG
jgi:hypothetical protein